MNIPERPEPNISFIKTGAALSLPVFLSLAILPIALFALLNFAPPQQSGDPGVQGDVFTGATITTTAQTAVVACSQGAGHIGRKTLVVENASSSSNPVTVTAELRTTAGAPSFTSGYLAVNNVATNTASSATVAPTAAAGRFCYVRAVSAGTSVVTITLRRE